MRRSKLLLFSGVLWCQAMGFALAAVPPAKVVEQFIEAHLQGQFAASRSLALEGVNVKASPFSNWLFAPGAGGEASTADVFLSRRFAQTFRYTIQGTAATGDNQVLVSVVRASPNLAHMYTWALAPRRGSTPYELIEALDAYLTKINFPVEESRMQFTLVREADSWYISAVFDEKFAQLQQQLQGQTQLSGTGSAPGATAQGAAGALGSVPAVTTTSSDLGRQLADAQFNATLQGFNRTYQPGGGAASAAAPKKDEDEPGLLGKVSRALFGSSSGGKTAAKNLTPSVNRTFSNIRDALARFAVTNSGVPAGNTIYNWKSLREVVNLYAKTPLPDTEEEAGFTFIDYKSEHNREGYVLLVELQTPQDGVKRVEVTPYGVDRN